MTLDGKQSTGTLSFSTQICPYMVTHKTYGKFNKMLGWPCNRLEAHEEGKEKVLHEPHLWPTCLTHSLTWFI